MEKLSVEGHDGAFARGLVHGECAAWTGPVAKYGRFAWSYKPDLKMPWVATDDIADLTAKELINATGKHRVIREVGSEEISVNDLAAIIGKEIGKPVEYRHIERTRKDVEAEFLKRFGTLEQWVDDTLTANALNNGVVCFAVDLTCGHCFQRWNGSSKTCGNRTISEGSLKQTNLKLFKCGAQTTLWHRSCDVASLAASGGNSLGTFDEWEP